MTVQVQQMSSAAEEKPPQGDVGSSEPAEPPPQEQPPSQKEVEQEEELQRRLQRPEDFEDADTRESNKKAEPGRRKAPKRKAEDDGQQKRGRGRPLGSPNKKKKKKRRRLSGVEKEEEVGQELVLGENGRPARRCKTNTNALVALSLEDEKMDIKFEDSSSEDDKDEEEKPLRPPRRKRRRSGRSLLAQPNVDEKKVVEESEERKTEAVQVAQPEEVEASSVDVEKSAESESAETNGHYSNTEQGETEAAEPSTSTIHTSDSSPQTQDPAPTPPQATPVKRGRGRPRLSEEKSAPPSVETTPKKGLKKKKKRKFRLSSKKKQYPPTTKKDQSSSKVERRGRPRKDSSTTPSPTKPKRLSVLTAPLSQLLPDLSPNVASPDNAPSTKRALSERERAAEIVREVTSPHTPFVCLKCEAPFGSYSRLWQHRANCQQKGSAYVFKSATTSSKASKSLDLTSASKVARSMDPVRYPQCSAEYSQLISSALRRVPETTFNSMNGSLCHVDTVDAERFRLAGGVEAISTVDKVRLNYSGRWTTEEVWETGGWELGSNPLSWHKYENAWSPTRAFLQRVSSLHWSQQRELKEVYDRSLQQSGRSRKRLLEGASADETKERRQALPLMLGLRQTGKSAKYMTATEREKARRAQKRAEERGKKAAAEPKLGELGGEWEKGHDFVCTVCCVSYDELREVLHHKWDAHPFCLVAHVTLQQSVALPPGDTLHPHLGRSVRSTAVKVDTSRTCSKCNTKVEESPGAFHAHVLECGGQENWDRALTGKKAKKRKSKGGPKRPPADPERAAEIRKARFARFEKPPPSANETGRMTRLQANIIQEEKNKKRKKKSPKKKKKSPVKKQQVEVRDEVVKEEVVQLKSRRGLRRSQRGNSINLVDNNFSLDGSKSSSSLNAVENNSEFESVKDEIVSENGSDKADNAVQNKVEENGVDEVAENKVEEKDNVRPPRRRASIAAIGVFETEKIVAAASAGRRRKSVDVREMVNNAKKAIVVNGARKNGLLQSMPGVGSKKGGKVAEKKEDSDKPEEVLSKAEEKTEKEEENVVVSEMVEEPTDKLEALKVSEPRSPEEQSSSSTTKELPQPPKKDPSEAKRKRDEEETASEQSDSSSTSSSSSAKRSRRSKKFSQTISSLVFPVEVKAYAVSRVAAGESHSRVARDLRCSQADLEKWCREGDSLVAQAEANARASPTPAKQPEEVSDERSEEPLKETKHLDKSEKSPPPAKKAKLDPENSNGLSKSDNSSSPSKVTPSKSPAPDKSEKRPSPMKKASPEKAVPVEESPAKKQSSPRNSPIKNDVPSEKSPKTPEKSQRTPEKSQRTSEKSPKTPEKSQRTPEKSPTLNLVKKSPSSSGKKKYQIVPYERDALLLKMRLRVEEVWKTKEVVGNGHITNGREVNHVNGAKGNDEIEDKDLPSFADDEDDEIGNGHAEGELAGNGGVASGLALIADSYGDEDDEYS